MKLFSIHFLFLFIINIAYAQPKYLNGTLLTERNRLPVQYATIYILGGDNDTTTNSGRFRLNINLSSHKEGGNLTIYIRRGNNSLHKKEIVIPNNLESEIKINLGEKIRGTILDKVTEQPIDGIEVILELNENVLSEDEKITDTSDVRGDYLFLIGENFIGNNIYATFKFFDSKKRYKYLKDNLDIRKDETIYLEPIIFTPPDTPPPRSPKMILIQGGSFYMGTNSKTNEQLKKVSIKDFYLCKYEVMVEEFEKFVKNSGYSTDAEKKGGSLFWNSKRMKQKNDTNWQYDAIGKIRPQSEYTHPVIHVSWNDAIEYCNWRSLKEGFELVYTITEDAVSINPNANGYRLPTEAEWEFAASSRGKDFQYAWGDENINGNFLDSSACLHLKWACTKENEHLNDNSPFTASVDKFQQGELGLYNLSGNVWEWCWDNYSYKSEVYRIRKGGSWSSMLNELKNANRSAKKSTYRSQNTGFRLARSKG